MAMRGMHPLGETHFKVSITSEVFKDLSRVARHRLVYEALAEEIKERVHALNIRALRAWGNLSITWYLKESGW